LTATQSKFLANVQYKINSSATAVKKN